VTLQRTGEIREVALEPVLLGVLACRGGEVVIISLMLSFRAATSPLASTRSIAVRSPCVTAVATSAMDRTWVVRFAASWLTLSVRTRHSPAALGTFA